MAGRVTVAEDIFDLQGVKIVVTSDDHMREVPPGQRPGPTEEVLARAGEPSFEIRLSRRLRGDEDVPDEVGLALRRVAERLFEVMPDGREVPGGDGPVEWIVGPTVHDGVVVMHLDTDGSGFRRPMINTMVGIFVEELTPLGMRVEISAASAHPNDVGRAWMSSVERRRV